MAYLGEVSVRSAERWITEWFLDNGLIVGAAQFGAASRHMSEGPEKNYENFIRDNLYPRTDSKQASRNAIRKHDAWTSFVDLHKH
jgi:hypothetical protein